MSEDFASTRPPDDLQFAPTITSAPAAEVAVTAAGDDGGRGRGGRRGRNRRGKPRRGRGGGTVSF